ncbi:MAG TPA: hypothetical protein VFZ66_26885 [Herpetosiphonaceae bacterium]
MSFDRRDIRKAMDVYTLDNVYLGSVLAVIPGPIAAGEGEVVPESCQTSRVSGELLGPMPTQTIGNPGPTTQSAARLYHTAADGAPPLGRGSITVGLWWGLLQRRTIPLDAIQTVSFERVVLKYRRDQI